MAVVQITLAFVKRGIVFPTVFSKQFPKSLPKYGAAACIFNVRNLSSIELSKNLELITKEKKTAKVTNLKLSTPLDKPMVILLSWLMAKRKHIYKFANYYTGHGFDVLNVSVSPWQLLWPTKGTQVIAGSILKFLELNTSNAPLVVHGFSVGGYLWGEVLVKIACDRERYDKIVNRIEGQVWDSVADITEICIGVPLAVFPKNMVLQNALKQYMLYHLKTFDKVATCHYVRSSQMFHTNLVKAPAQFFLSKTDSVGAEKSNLRARENWENMNIKVCWKCWDNSPHVGHFHRHPKEYIDELNAFLNTIGLVAYPEKLQVKV
ncbi:hypothetical protein ILUMI_22069 [Ignelater luminosus]|uniref:Transmembrane protein 53 n=1 Tax=Ignelater luminosus TaxID=2038154 RepID=A0A8K0G2Y4_IGNLU|nr:hypothetical protein ILUMI_22069 [Ignelater luminosus]